MTLIGLAAALAWAGVLIFVTLRAEGCFRAWLTTQTPTHTPAPGLSGPSRTEIELPADLVAYVNGESELWAREDVQKAIQEKYLEHYVPGDPGESWNRVRRAYGLGEVQPA